MEKNKKSRLLHGIVGIALGAVGFALGIFSVMYAFRYHGGSSNGMYPFLILTPLAFISASAGFFISCYSNKILRIIGITLNAILMIMLAKPMLWFLSWILFSIYGM